MKTKWAYKYFVLPAKSEAATLNALNHLGSQGWKLCGGFQLTKHPDHPPNLKGLFMRSWDPGPHAQQVPSGRRLPL